MPELLGWWVYVVGVPLSGGALLTLFSLGGRGKGGRAKNGRGQKGVRHGKSVPKTPIKIPAKVAPKTLVQRPPKTAANSKIAPAKLPRRQTRAAELPPLFMAQSFLLIWSLVALAAVPFHPQNAAPLALALLLSAIALVSVALLAVSAQVFVRLTPVDASSISYKGDLQGRVGECDATIDSRKGSVLVRDEFGTLHHFAARCDEPIARGEAVLLTEYQQDGDFFQVRVWRD